jgi:hypothetical protein
MMSSSNIEFGVEEARATGSSHGSFVLLSFDLVSFSCAMVNEFFLVLPHTPLKFVSKTVNGSVHIFFRVVGIDRTAININPGFCLVTQFLDRQDTVYIRHEIEMTLDFLDLGFDVSPECIGNFDVMA